MGYALCRQTHGDFGSGWCHFLVLKMCHLVCLLRAPWGTIERSRDTLEHKKGDVGIQAWISADFGWASGRHFEVFWSALGQRFFCHACL